MISHNTLEYIAIVMAGGIRRAPLHQALGRPALALPIAPGVSLLERWLEMLGDAGRCVQVHVIVSDPADGEALRMIDVPAEAPDLDVVIETGRWRGTGGLLHDVTRAWGSELPVLAVEGACVPPRAFGRIVQPLGVGEMARVGVGLERRPAGLSLLSAEALATVPDIGFCDLKEQLLPDLYARGTPARAVSLDESVGCVRDRETYLDAVRRCATTDTDPAHGRRWGTGTSLVEAGARVADEVMLHDAVVLRGGVVERGAVVSRAVIGPGGVVPAESVVRDRIESAASLRQLEVS